MAKYRSNIGIGRHNDLIAGDALRPAQYIREELNGASRPWLHTYYIRYADIFC